MLVLPRIRLRVRTLTVSMDPDTAVVRLNSDKAALKAIQSCLLFTTEAEINAEIMACFIAICLC